MAKDDGEGNAYSQLIDGKSTASNLGPKYSAAFLTLGEAESSSGR